MKKLLSIMLVLTMALTLLSPAQAAPARLRRRRQLGPASGSALLLLRALREIMRARR